MKNILSFDIINIHATQPKMFTVRFNKDIVISKTVISGQETITIEFDNAPGQHLLELLLIDLQNNGSEIVIGNFKINHHECIDSRVNRLFKGPAEFDGSLKGLVKFELLIDTPILAWQQKKRIY